MEWIATAQRELRSQGLAGWLIYDFRGSNPVLRRFLTLGGLLTRRVFLMVPAEGEPTLLVHAIERGSLPGLPFAVRAYDSRQALERELAALLPHGAVAMEYSPRNDIPYLSHVDAGTIEMVRELGAVPRSSGALLQVFSAWTPQQLAAHERAAAQVMAAVDHAFTHLRSELAAGRRPAETEVQRLISDFFDDRGLVYDHPPIVGFGAHSGDPHHIPGARGERRLERGDVVLIDLWAREPDEGAPYADVTWMGVWGEPSPALREVFEVVTQGRDLALRFMTEELGSGRRPEGREVDRRVRDFIAGRGYGAAFLHRTGHSLGSRSTHGEAVHLDDFETRDTRRLIPGVGVTVEPGVYLADFGVRSEIDVVIEEGGPRVTTGLQRELERLDA